MSYVNGTDLDDTQVPSASPPSPISLEHAVRQYPSVAIEKVAAVLGLIEENFVAFKRRALEAQQRPQYVEKRMHLQQTQDREETKRQRLQLRTAQVPESPITLSQLVRNSPSESIKSSVPRLEYDDMSTTKRQKEKNRKTVVCNHLWYIATHGMHKVWKAFPIQ